MPLELQAKLLDVIENKENFPLGGGKSIKVDVRIIAATNREIEKEVEKGNFRKDLYYRLNVLRINIPPLRERKEDIRCIAEYYLKKFCEEYNKPYYEFSEEALNFIENYPFLGNVRELKNIIEKYVIKKEKGRIISRDEIKSCIYNYDVWEPKINLDEIKPLREVLRNFRKEYVMRVLEKCNKNITLAARMLKIHRVHLQRILKEK